jgi:hypothetical protein
MTQPGLSNSLKVDLAGRYSNPVEVMEHYSNHAGQGERVSAVLESVPATPRKPETRTTK